MGHPWDSFWLGWALGAACEWIWRWYRDRLTNPHVEALEAELQRLQAEDVEWAKRMHEEPPAC